jgi:hypothetical protein
VSIHILISVGLALFQMEVLAAWVGALPPVWECTDRELRGQIAVALLVLACMITFSLLAGPLISGRCCATMEAW